MNFFRTLRARCPENIGGNVEKVVCYAVYEKWAQEKL